MDQAAELSKDAGDVREPQATRPSSKANSIREDIAEAFRRVPEIGNGWRWYDPPYRALRWLNRGWRRKVLGQGASSALLRARNFLLVFNTHDRNRAWPLASPTTNVSVPTDERVERPGLWLVELFPPNQLPLLERSLKRNGWHGRRPPLGAGDENYKLLKVARAGQGALWWSLADVVRTGANFRMLDSVSDFLPPEFDVVRLRAVQVGSGLTAVVARFVLTDEAEQSLDAIWHRQHEPALERTKRGRQALNRKEATFKAVQSERRRLHYVARDWLADRLPGFFAGNDKPQPLFEMLLFDQLDPTSSGQVDSFDEEHRGALRALGIDPYERFMLSSPSLPKLVLQRIDDNLHEVFEGDPTWTLWGSLRAITGAVESRHLEMYGGPTGRAIASLLVDNAYGFLTLLAIHDFLSAMESRYADVRDRAALQHGNFSARALRGFRKNTLDLGMNLISAHRDLLTVLDGPMPTLDEPSFYYSPESRGVGGQLDATGESFNSVLRQQYAERFQRLIEADRDYREILSTVAALGASADSYLISRYALVVAVISLFVATATVLVANVGPDSLISQGWRWIQGWVGRG